MNRHYSRLHKYFELNMKDLIFKMLNKNVMTMPSRKNSVLLRGASMSEVVKEAVLLIKVFIGF